MKVAILTVSDRVSRGEALDRSGPALAALVLAQGWDVAFTATVADEAASITAQVKQWTDEVPGTVQLVLTTGGTGFGVRDVTPEAITPILDRLALGLTVAMLSASLQITPMAALSRPVCGTRNRTLIITLPGSPKGATENLTALLKVIPHAVELNTGGSGETTHTAMMNATTTAAIAPTVNPTKHHYHHVCTHKSDVVHVGQVSAFGLSPDLSAPVSSRVRKSLYPLVPFDKALATVMEMTPVLAPMKRKVTEELVGHVLAEDVKAVDPVPGYRASVVDGYAVISTDGPGIYPVSQTQSAGTTTTTPASTRLFPKTIARITTGAMVPEGADAVIMVEDTTLVSFSPTTGEELDIHIHTTARAGENIRPIGSDAHVGQIILPRGSLVSSPGGELGLLASVGVLEAWVHPHPVVTILSSGNELVEYTTPSPLPAGCVRDTNFPTLSSAIRTAMPGCTVLSKDDSSRLHTAQDTQESLYTLLRDAIQGPAHVIITTGGVSMGEADLMKGVLERRLGAQIWFGRVLMKPGKPTTFATVRKEGAGEGGVKLVFSLPGNPVSALVGFYLFVLPALRKMAGYPSPQLTSITTKVAHSITLDARPEFYRARITVENGAAKSGGSPFLAHGTGSQMSSRMLSMRGANAMLKLPAATETRAELKEGEEVEAFLFGEL
ncbi:hypothetical protein HDU98_008766 [Podochytrium sp. JEL0797]|nr:hypothetical protein HDU98_008766 [Podochytrium sp. JEL0797]